MKKKIKCKAKELKQLLEQLGFMAEVLCFFLSGWMLAKGKIMWTIFLIIGFILSFLVGDLIYQRGKSLLKEKKMNKENKKW